MKVVASSPWEMPMGPYILHMIARITLKCPVLLHCLNTKIHPVVWYMAFYFILTFKKFYFTNKFVLIVSITHANFA